MQYHLHVYFDDATDEQAWALREQLENRPEVESLGRFHTQPVGPHPCRQFQILTHDTQLDSLVAWLEAHRGNLSGLIHPEIEDDYAAHTTEATWLGAPHPLRLEIFQS